jgi:hypothetical protein
VRLCIAAIATVVHKDFLVPKSMAHLVFAAFDKAVRRRVIVRKKRRVSMDFVPRQTSLSTVAKRLVALQVHLVYLRLVGTGRVVPKDCHVSRHAIVSMAFLARWVSVPKVPIRSTVAKMRVVRPEVPVKAAKVG